MTLQLGFVELPVWVLLGFTGTNHYGHILAENQPDWSYINPTTI
jgi:hypothetical protein